MSLLCPFAWTQAQACLENVWLNSMFLHEDGLQNIYEDRIHSSDLSYECQRTPQWYAYTGVWVTEYITLALGVGLHCTSSLNSFRMTPVGTGRSLTITGKTDLSWGN